MPSTFCENKQLQPLLRCLICTCQTTAVSSWTNALLVSQRRFQFMEDEEAQRLKVEHCCTRQQTLCPLTVTDLKRGSCPRTKQLKWLTYSQYFQTLRILKS